ncbi:MAG: radical SAM protein [Candidatus Aenigmarchaeota archaeon]|nr:radical SAM protein [Candidatus Aenigmarchaeota archaeon]
MAEIQTIAEIRRWLGNPIARAILNKSVKREKVRKSMLELALEHLVFGTKCSLGCKFYSWFIGMLIKNSAKIFGTDPEEVLNALKEPVFRRGIINVLEGITRFGVQTPQTTAAPFLIVWQFTNKCNLKCKHCYASAMSKSMPNELTTEEAKKLVDELAECGVVAIAFSGGEPLIREDFFEVARYAKENDFYISVATNGILITPSIAKKLKDCVNYVEVSLDGMKETHEKFRGISGIFDRTIRGIKNCVKQGLDVCVAPTITKYNLKEIPNLLELAKELRVNRFIAFNFIPTGRGKDILEQDITPEEREEILKFLYSKLLEKDYPDVFSTAPQYARISIQATEKDSSAPILPTHFAGKRARKALKGKAQVLADFIGGCGAGRVYCCIEPNGDIWPCVDPDTYIQSSNGEIIKINDLKVEDPISCDTKNMSIEPDICVGKRKDVKKIYEIVTNTDIIYASDNHPFFVFDGNEIKIVQLKDLKKGDYLLKVRKLPIKGEIQKLPEVDFVHYKLTNAGIKFLRKKIKRKDVGKFAKQLGVTRYTLLEFLGLRKDRKNIGLKKETILKLCKILALDFIKKYFKPSGYSNFKIPEYATYEFCRFVGYVLGDAHVDKNTLSFKDSRLEVAKYYANLSHKLFGIKPTIKKKGRSYHVIISSRAISKLFLKILGTSTSGKSATYSTERTVPEIIQKSNIKGVEAFLGGFYDAEGSVGPRWVSLVSGSKDLLRQIKLLLLRFGISTSHLKKHTGVGKGFRIDIPLGYMEEFMKIIEFKSSEKNIKLKKIPKKRYCKYPRYPLCGEFKKILRLLRIKVPQILSQHDVSRDNCISLVQLCKERINKLERNQDILITQREAAETLSMERRKFSYCFSKNKLSIENLNKLRLVKESRLEEAKKILNKIERFLNSEMEVDKILNISYVREGEVYDIQTLKNHTFIANTFIVHNCVFMPIRVGSIREKTFKEIWLNSEVLNKLRDRSKLKEYCGVCEWRNVCGGCRARAYAYFNDIQAPDPGCINNKVFWEKIKA